MLMFACQQGMLNDLWSVPSLAGAVVPYGNHQWPELWSLGEVDCFVGAPMRLGAFMSCNDLK